MAQLNPTIQNDHSHLSDSLKRSIVGCISELGTVVLKNMNNVVGVYPEDFTSHLHEQLMFFVYRMVFLHLAESKGLWMNNGQPIASLHQLDNGWQVLLERCQTVWFGDEEKEILPVELICGILQGVA